MGILQDLSRNVKSMEKGSITAIILTYNEEQHIERCVSSLRPFCKDILVVDSFSTDRTIDLAQRMNVRIVKHEFVHQAQQFNWALEACDIQTDWVWRVDADEYVSEELGRKVVSTTANCDEEVNGIYVNKKIIFQGGFLKHGGWYPAPQIKIIRKGFGASENKVMDEHLIVFSGETIAIDGDQTDENLNDLTWWINKHNRYATREAINMMRIEYNLSESEEEVTPSLWGNDAERKRRLKNAYVRLPLFLRPILYFTARYIILLGFLDGIPGLIWHVLQGFWYRFLVDAKVYEIKKKYRFDKTEIKNFLKSNYKQATISGTNE